MSAEKITASQTEGMGGEPEQDYPDMEEHGLDEPLEEALREILLGGQGDDNGAQIMPDFQEGQSVPSMVHACIALLETRRDVIEGYANTEAQLRHRIAALTPPETAEAVPVAWPNGCDQTVPEALRFLANNDRPSGGEQRFNSAHLYQLADEIEKALRLTIHPEAARLRENLERVTRELEEETALRVGAIDRMKEAEHERDDAVKVLESVTEELGLFRDFVINNAIVWTLGSNHHHPIWARIAGRLEGYTSPRDGEKWSLVRAATASDPAPATDDRERLVEANHRLMNLLYLADEALMELHGCFPNDEVTEEQRRLKQTCKAIRALTGEDYLNRKGRAAVARAALTTEASK